MQREWDRYLLQLNASKLLQFVVMPVNILRTRLVRTWTVRVLIRGRDAFELLIVVVQQERPCIQFHVRTC